MTSIDTLCFDDFDTVAGGATNGPTIDGFLFHDLGFENRDKVESGYVRGCRYVWNGGSESVLEYQGVKADRFLVFGFFSRFDPSFNDSDRIVIAIKPSDVAPVDQHRRIDIAPVHTGIGAAKLNGSTRPVAASGETTQDSDLPSPLPERDPPDIQPNYPPKEVQTWKGFTPTMAEPDKRWEQLTAFDATLAVKVRSWTPPSIGGASPGVGWSVEIKLPIDAVGTDWPGIPNNFKLFMTVLRFTGTPGGFVHPKRQFPRDRPPLSGTFGALLDIPAISYGTGLIGAGLGSGVRFKNDWQGLGRLSGGMIVHDVKRLSVNTLVARIENTSTSDTANNVVAEFRFGKYGLPPGGAPGSERWRDWRQFNNMSPPGPVYPKRTSPQSLTVSPPGNSVDLTQEWTLSSAERSEFDPPDEHRCMVGQLFSTQDVNFVQSSVRSNMNFVNLSDHEREAEVSGVGYEDPPDGGPDHDFVLFSFSRVIPGSHVLELDPELAGGTSIEGLTKNLLTALARPSTGNEEGYEPSEYVGKTIRISASELYWGPSDRKAQTLQISAIKISPDERLRVRILSSSMLQEQNFGWEGLNGQLAPDQAISLTVLPRPQEELEKSGSLKGEILFSVYRYVSGDSTNRDGRWEFVEQGAIALHKDGEASVIPDPRNPVESLKQALVILWITFGYRRTGQFLTIDGITSAVLDDEPGAFGLVALHQGVDDNVGWSLSGPGLTTLAPGITSLKVPHQGSTNLNVRLFAKPDGPRGDAGPRLVQVVHHKLEWDSRDSAPKLVGFTQLRKLPSATVRLEIAESPTSDDIDFVWPNLSAGMEVNKTISLSVQPPQDEAKSYRSSQIRYRILTVPPGGGPETLLEQGRVWLVKHGLSDSEPLPPGCLPIGWLRGLRMCFRSFLSFITRVRQ
jgi:hypothetical protein